MAKKIAPRKKSSDSPARLTAATLPPLNGNGWLFLNDFRWQALVIIVVGVLFYWNTTKDYYALDDDIIMRQNLYVQKGISGIPEILGNDAYQSYYDGQHAGQQLAGGRYRPLSVVTFAIEQSLFGDCYGDRSKEVSDSLYDYQQKGITDITTNKLIIENNYYDKKIKDSGIALAPIRHGFQIFWFVLSMIVVLWLLREHIFRGNTDVAFLSVLLFTIHPIHTEVIANVKSRDEIFSLLFIALTMICFFRFDLERKPKQVIWGMVFFFLALLSKEYAAMLIFLMPMSLVLFHGRKRSDLNYLILPITGVIFLYAVTRLACVGAATHPGGKQDPLNDPYMYTKKNSLQKICSKINRLDDYLWLCLIPYPLAADYSYQHFPYSDPTDPMVWLSFAVMIGMVALTIRLWRERHPMAFAALFYMLFFAMICNMFFDIGATMGERLIYHSSLGICMAVAWLMIKGVEKLTKGEFGVGQKAMLSVAFILIAIPAFMETYKRNAEWKNDFTLFTKDAKTHPNSALTNGNAGSNYMDLGLHWLGHDTIIGRDTLQHYGRDTVKVHRYADTAMIYLIRATTIHKDYANGFLNLGLCYYYKDDFELAAQAWGRAYEILPGSVNLYNYENMLNEQANIAAQKRDFKRAQRFMYCLTVVTPNDPKRWADYGGASYMAMDFVTADAAFSQEYDLLQKQIDDIQSSAKGTLTDPQQQQIAACKQQQKGLMNGLGASRQNERNMRAWKRDTMNVDSTIVLAKAMMGTPDFFPTSRRLLNHALEIKPNDERATKLLDSLATLEKKNPPPPPVKPVPASAK
jgi:tetratricopeptide (TPR) repeat protein